MTDSDFELIQPISWNKIWTDWRALEVDHWREHYQSRGFQTWDEWRDRYWKQIKPETRIWTLQKIKNLESDIPRFYVGPFQGWTKYYIDRENSIFAEIAKLRLENENEIPAKYFVENFPKSTRLIGLQYQNKIMIMDGTHRCLAFSLLVARNQIPKSDIEIALTNLNEKDQKLFENLWNHPIQVPLASNIQLPTSN